MNKNSSRPRHAVTPELVRQALSYIPPDVDRDTWARLAMAIKSEFPDTTGFDLWNDWSAQGQGYDVHAARDTWRSVKAGGKVTIGTLFGIAKDRGFSFPEANAKSRAAPPSEAEQAHLAEQKRLQREAEEAEYRKRADQAARDAAKLWDDASEQGASPYLQRKGVAGHGVRYLPDGTLLVPMRNEAGELQNLQRIAPAKPTAEQEARGLREKRFMAGGRKTGLWHLIGLEDEAPAVLLLAEGYATAASLHEAAGHPVVVAFDAGNLVHVAKALRALYPQALLLVCGDDDQATEARTGKNPGREKAASAARAAAVQGAALAGVVLPQGLPEGGSDFNDLAQHAGAAEVARQVGAALQVLAVPGSRRAAQVARGGASGGETRPGVQTTAGESAEGAGPSSDDDQPGEPADGGDGQPDPFMLDERGVWHVPRDAEGNEKRPVWLCAPLRITARTRADDANGWGLLLEFNDLDGNAKTWAMPAALLSGEGAEWAARLRDMGLDMAHGTAARNRVGQYINSRHPRERVTCTDRLGWHPGGVFVLPSRCIGEAEGVRYVFQSEAGMEDSYKRAGTLAEWQQQVAALCQDNSRLVFGVSAALAGALLQPAGLESGGFHFRGDSSKGKTTTLKVAASVWGRPSYMQTWRATSNAIEGTAMQHCDGVLILDEIGQVDGRELGETVYMLGNAQNKNRSTARGFNRRRLTWRILWLSSGEKSMADHMAEAGKRAMAGQEVRMVDVPLDAGAGMGGLEELHGQDGPGALAEAVTKAGARLYGSAGRAWLEWLAPRFEALPGLLSPAIERHRGDMVPEAASEQVRRVGNRFALVAAAGELAIEAGILPWPAGHAAWAVRECFNAWLAARGHLDNGEEVAMLRQVRAFLETNGEALFTWHHRGMEDHKPNTPLRAGFRIMMGGDGEPIKADSATDYLERTGSASQERKEALVDYMIFRERFREICKGFDASAVATLLRQRGHLVHEKDRLMNKRRLPGMGLTAYYHVKASIFADAL